MVSGKGEPRSAGEVTVSSLDERERNRPGFVDVGKEFAKIEMLAGALLLLCIVAHKPFELQLAGDVARAIARLPQVEKLFECDQVAARVRPSARCPSRVKTPGFPQAHLIRLHVERRQTARGPVGQHDPDDFPTPRVVVIESGLHERFLHRCRQAFGAAVKHVVQRRQATNRTVVGLLLDPRQLDPVIVMGE